MVRDLVYSCLCWLFYSKRLTFKKVCVLHGMNYLARARAVRLWNDIMSVMCSQHDARFTIWVTCRNKWLAEVCWFAWNVGWWKINLLCCPCFSWLWTHGKVNSVSCDLSSCLTAEGKHFYLTLCRCSHMPVTLIQASCHAMFFSLVLISWFFVDTNATLNRARNCSLFNTLINGSHLSSGASQARMKTEQKLEVKDHAFLL